MTGICLVLSGSVLSGINYALRMKRRRDNLRDIERILIYLESEIRYRHSVIKEALLNASKKSDRHFAKWLEYLVDRLKYSDGASDGFYEIWSDSLEILKEDTYLTDNDIAGLLPIGQTLGYLDIEAQMAGFVLEIDNIHEKISECNSGLINRMRVSVISGAVFGILIVIVLV